jgi:hypothetical protein
MSEIGVAQRSNAAEQLYVVVQDSAGKVEVVRLYVDDMGHGPPAGQ